MDQVEEQDTSPYDLILEVGAEGGSLRLMATRTLPTQYAAFMDDQSLVMIDEGEAIHRRSPWGGWAQAIQAMSRYPWPRLSPHWVHPEYAPRIWPLLEPLWDSMREHNRLKWAKLCGQDAEHPDFDTGPLKAGERVVHPTVPEWGIGAVLENSDGRVARVFFELVGEKSVRLDVARLRRVRDEAARSLVLDNLKMQGGKPSVYYRSVPATIDFFLKEFPGGFQGERFRFHEQDHKRQIHAMAAEELGRERMRQALAAGQHADLAERAIKLIGARGNAMIHLHEKLALANGLEGNVAAQQLLAERLFGVLHGEGDFPGRFDAWAAALEEIGAAKWPIATYFLFFVHPDRHMFVKPTITQHMAEICAFDINYRSQVNARTYVRIMEFSAYLKQAIAELKPADMIDVQSFMWCIAPGTYSNGS